MFTKTLHENVMVHHPHCAMFPVSVGVVVLLVTLSFKSDVQIHSFALPVKATRSLSYAANTGGGLNLRHSFVVEQNEAEQTRRTADPHKLTLTTAWLAVKCKLGLTYAGRKRLEAKTESALKRFLQWWINFGYGSGRTLQEFDIILLRVFIPSTAVGIGVAILADCMPKTYQAFWHGMVMMSYLNRVYFTATTIVFNVASVLACLWVGMPLVLSFSAISAGLNGLQHLEQATPFSFLSIARNKVPISLFTRCVSGPLDEELTYRYLPAAILSALFRRTWRRSIPSERYKSMRTRILFCFSILFGLGHVENHIVDLAATPEFAMVYRATVQSLRAFYFANYMLVPLFEERGLAAAIGAHIAWNTCVAVGKKCIPVLLVIAMIRRFRMTPNSAFIRYERRAKDGVLRGFGDSFAPSVFAMAIIIIISCCDL